MSATPHTSVTTPNTVKAVEHQATNDWRLWSAYSPEPTPTPQDPADALIERINSDPFTLLQLTNAFSDVPVVDLTRIPSTPARRCHRTPTPYPITSVTLDDAFTVQLHGYTVPRINTVTVRHNNPVKDVTIWKIEAKNRYLSRRGRQYKELGIQYFFKTPEPASVKYNTMWHNLDDHHREIAINYLAKRIANANGHRGVRIARRQAEALALGNY